MRRHNPRRLPEFVAEEVFAHLVEGEIAGFLHPDPIGQHQLRQFDPVDEDDSAVPVVAGGFDRVRLEGGGGIGSPATDFALRVARDGANEDLDFISNYAGHSPKNASPMRSASYFVRNGSRVIGLLCINIDESAYRDAGRALESLLGLYPQPAAPSDSAAEPETLASSVEEIIDNALSVAFQDLGLSKHGLDNHERTAVFERLDIAGVFQLKGAVAELAVQIGISEPTVYRTLRAIRGDLP
ncbi:transcriptional regulator [Trueperella pyogenes]|uniref:helix-turn-helix transcriptional regulator n=1 Tax=Trueperella pyogenes TaxID=1661 RepID=UPI000D2580F3|nr:helix-turn-helix domain-containing protein [Trueperella pyogenes]AWA44204.1 hypothetical protein DBV13_09480 [Trueperella pyogenes]